MRKQRRTLMERDHLIVYVEYEEDNQAIHDALDRLQAAVSDPAEIKPQFRAILARIDRGGEKT